MKEIKTERKVYDISYEASDGTPFYSKEECEIYEKSARAVLRGKFKKLVVHEGNEYSIFQVGCEDTTIYAVKMETEADANAVKQLWEMDHDYLWHKDCYSDRQASAYSKIDAAYTEKDILFVGEDCEGSIYIIDIRSHIINDLQNIDKKQDDTEGQS